MENSLALSRKKIRIQIPYDCNYTYACIYIVEKLIAMYTKYIQIYTETFLITQSWNNPITQHFRIDLEQWPTNKMFWKLEEREDRVSPDDTFPTGVIMSPRRQKLVLVRWKKILLYLYLKHIYTIYIQCINKYKVYLQALKFHGCRNGVGI